jgi:hypothetical protein
MTKKIILGVFAYPQGYAYLRLNTTEIKLFRYRHLGDKGKRIYSSYYS